MICRSALRATIGAPKLKRLILAATLATAAALLRGLLSHALSSVIGTQIAAASCVTPFSSDIVVAPRALRASNRWEAIINRHRGQSSGCPFRRGETCPRLARETKEGG